jgi:hypothetical protein
MEIIDSFEPVNGQVFLFTQILVTVVALFLTGLAVRAWKNTKLKKIIYVSIAFSLFAVIHIFNYADQAILDFVSDDLRHVIIAILELSIMGLFVLAIIKK